METNDVLYEILNEVINLIDSSVVKIVFSVFLTFSVFRVMFHFICYYSRVPVIKKELISESQEIEHTQIYDPLDPDFYVDPYDDFRG